HSFATLVRPFSYHLLRLLVFAQAQKGGLTEMIITGPLAKTDLANQLGFKPGTLSHFSCSKTFAGTRQIFREVGKWTIRTEQGLKFAMELFQCLLIKSCPDFGVKQQLISLIIAYQDSTEIAAPALRRRVTSDDKLLLIAPFEFDPRAGAPP